MPTITPISEEELLGISAATLKRVERFISIPESGTISSKELASLARQILKDIGRENNMIQNLLMIQTLRQLRSK